MPRGGVGRGGRQHALVAYACAVSAEYGMLAQTAVEAKRVAVIVR
jgi:hypothetical protein